MHSTNINTAIKILLTTYIISIGFTDALHLPGFLSRIQISEIIFAPLFLVWTIAIIKNKKPFPLKRNRLIQTIFCLLLVFLLSAAVNLHLKGWLETITLMYLILVFAIVSTSILFFRVSVDHVLNSFIVCGVITAVCGISGWILERSGISNPMVMPAEIYYPYLGHVGRATGWMDSPNMYHNLLGVCFLIFLSKFLGTQHKRTTHYIILLVLVTGIILSFSKTILLLAIGVMLVLYLHFKSAKNIYLLSSLLLFMICMVGSHFLFIHTSDKTWRDRNEKAYFEKTPVGEIADLEIYLTNYAINKISSFKAGLEHPVLGVGPGGHNAYVKELKNKGEYPEYFINFDPHSTYLGTFAETGILGMFALTFLGIQIYRVLKKITETKPLNDMIRIGVPVTFLFLAMEAIVLDILNFRHLWILTGILAYYLFSTIQITHDSNQNLLFENPDDIQPIGKEQ